jgi:hypothetical protein
MFGVARTRFTSWLGLESLRRVISNIIVVDVMPSPDEVTTPANDDNGR